jgi:hypothetical protein
MTENVMKLSSPQIPGNALVFYKEWTPLMEELKMHEQDDIVPPHTISMDNMVAGGVARLPQEVTVRSASSLAPTACARKSCGQKILGGQQPPLHGRRPGKSLGPADAAANFEWHQWMDSQKDS